MSKFHSKSSGMSLDDRMKNNYENAYRIKLPRRMPVILRLDGKAFHTFTRGMNKPFSIELMDLMDDTTKYLLDNIQNAVLGYTQSDEISILIMNYKELNTDSWFDNNLQKMVSVAAAMATSYFCVEYNYQHLYDNEPLPFIPRKYIQFDCRAFVLPESEVNNYFISRQNDCTRNAIQMIGQSHYSQKQLHGKKCTDIVEMLNNDNAVEKKYESYSWREKFGATFLRKATAQGFTGFEVSQFAFKRSPEVTNKLLEPTEE